jgi:hypothetical protein
MMRKAAAGKKKRKKKREEDSGRGLHLEHSKGEASALPEVLAPDATKRTGYVDDMAVDLAGDMGERKEIQKTKKA